jgi:hypothetical protein
MDAEDITARQTRAYHDMDVVQYDSECLCDGS